MVSACLFLRLLTGLLATNGYRGDFLPSMMRPPKGRFGQGLCSTSAAQALEVHILAEATRVPQQAASAAILACSLTDCRGVRDTILGTPFSITGSAYAFANDSKAKTMSAVGALILRFQLSSTNCFPTASWLQ